MSSTLDTAQNASTNDVLKNAFSYVTDGLYFTYQNTKLWYGAQVEHVAVWTEDMLGKPIGEVVRRALNCLPIIAAYHLLPGCITFPCLAAYVIVHLVATKPFSDDFYRTLYDGLGFSCGIEALQTLASLQLVKAAACALVAKYFFSKAAAVDSASASNPAAASVGSSDSPRAEVGAAAAGGASAPAAATNSSAAS